MNASLERKIDANFFCANILDYSLAISIASIIKIFRKKDWSLGNFFRVEDVDEEN
ncbi:MAG: hypothetical protein Ct9H90mP20_5590 [Candidatus Neomarinimicrobiota bacterium]|nr:MAG: hypothetical protein Ct9H90mP20_5590 [Candidatus Neomarinimicrobiota bacterium]